MPSLVVMFVFGCQLFKIEFLEFSKNEHFMIIHSSKTSNSQNIETAILNYPKAENKYRH